MSLSRGSQNGGHFYSNLTQPYKIDLSFIVDAANGNGLGVRSIKSNGYVRNVFMHTTSTPGQGDGMVNPNPAVGFAMIQMKQNFNSYLGGFTGFVSPTTGSTAVINSTALTIGNPYIIATVGTTPAAHFTIAPVADVSGSLAGKYFLLSDAFSNNYVIYNVVSGVGLPPSLTGSLANYVAIPNAIATGATAAQVGTALTTTIAALNSSNSFTATGTTTVTVTNKSTVSLILSPAPQDVNTTFTIGAITYTKLANDWQHVGVQPGLTPAVGLSFIATHTGGAVGSGTVISPGISGITSVEVIGDPGASIANSSIAANGGAIILVQFLAATSTSVTTPLATAPTANSVVGMSFFFDASSVTIDGL